MPSADRLGYVPALDGLRGVAILSVLALHFRLPLSEGGFLGVDIFFVLSGFLITTLLAEEWRAQGAVSLPRFYLRRGMRLLPALVPLVLVASPVLDPLVPLLALIYMLNWALVANPDLGVGSLEHTWSLAIEGQFYVLWPFVLLLLLRVRHTALRLTVPFVLALAVALNRILLWEGPASSPRLYYGTDTRGEGLLLGAGVALLLAAYPSGAPAPLRKFFPVLAVVAPSVVAAILLFARDTSGWLYEGGLTILGLGVAAIILQACWRPSSATGRVLTLPPLVYLGRISYSLYLWHFPISGLAVRYGPAEIAAGIAFSLLLAVLSYRCLEQPAARLKSRWGRRGDH